MNRKHAKTLTAIFESPVRRDLRWAEVQALLRALEAKVVQREGSRVRVMLAHFEPGAAHPTRRPITETIPGARSAPISN